MCLGWVLRHFAIVSIMHMFFYYGIAFISIIMLNKLFPFYLFIDFYLIMNHPCLTIIFRISKVINHPDISLFFLRFCPLDFTFSNQIYSNISRHNVRAESQFYHF